MNNRQCLTVSCRVDSTAAIPGFRESAMWFISAAPLDASMVSKITIFEPHFDGAQFGPASIGSDAPDGQEVDPEAEQLTTQSTGPSRLRLLLGAGGLSFGLLLGFLTARRLRTEPMEAIDFEDQPEDGDVTDRSIDELHTP